METIQTPLEGVLLIKPKVFGDVRGYFMESWQEKRYAAVGIDLPFVQDNHSCSSYGILRGLHFQKHKPQGKLVSVTLGSVFDVAVDIRKNSPTYGKWYGVELSGDNHHQLWVPPGLAHGFVVTSDVAHFMYKVTDFYDPDDEGVYAWNSPELGIDWPIKNPKLSEKDGKAQSWSRT